VTTLHAMTATLTTTVHTACPRCLAEMSVPYRAEVIGRHSGNAERSGPCEVCGCDIFALAALDRMEEKAIGLARSFAESGGQ